MGSGARGDIRRRLAVVLAVLTASGVLALAAPGSAQAAPASCTGRKVRTLAFATGSVHVYKGGGRICAITYQKTPGTKRRISVSVQARGHVAVKKSRSHTRSSEPVSVYAGNRPVRVTGSVGTGSYASGWIHF